MTGVHGTLDSTVQTSGPCDLCNRTLRTRLSRVTAKEMVLPLDSSRRSPLLSATSRKRRLHRAPSTQAHRGAMLQPKTTARPSRAGTSSLPAPFGWATCCTNTQPRSTGPPLIETTLDLPHLHLKLCNDGENIDGDCGRGSGVSRPLKQWMILLPSPGRSPCSPKRLYQSLALRQQSPPSLFSHAEERDEEI